jgi:uncharacterized protein YjbI with pentapeptide repeats
MDAVDTPFTKAGERERAWSAYRSFLIRQVDESMFGEPFGLSQVYIPLRAYYEERPTKADTRDLSDGSAEKEDKVTRVACNLLEEVERWRNSRTRDDAVKVISGGPGSGKSSFAKMYAAKLAREREKVLLIFLHQLDLADDLVDAVGELLQDAGILPYNPIKDKGKRPQLLIFDGLDEIAKQGTVSAEIAQAFVREVERTVRRHNATELNLQVLITGRELLVEANKPELRKHRQVLYVLPYLISNGDAYKDPDKVTRQDQRHDWWQRYGKAIGVDLSGIPNELIRKDLDEVTAQPLLNYLLALSYRRDEIDFTKEVDLNSIYRDLLEAVYERAYEGRPWAGISELGPDHFIRMLEEIGLAAWHGKGRTTTISEIKKHCRRSGLDRLLEPFLKGAEVGAPRLLTAFYFRQGIRRQSGEPTFEFTHKSFGEYLAARRVVRGLGKMATELDRRKESLDDGWDVRSALLHWIELCGKSSLDNYIVPFIRREVDNNGKEIAGHWQKMLCRLIEEVLRRGMPLEKLDERPSYHEECILARNAEEALLVAVSACALVTDELSRIDWPDDSAAGTWFRKLQGQRTSRKNTLSFFSLNHLQLDGQCLHIADLHSSRLFKASLIESDSYMLNLERADLQETDLQQAYLQGANLAGANLTGVNLQAADLNGAHLQNANLCEAVLLGADLMGAELYGAILQNANLRGAELQSAILQSTNLRGADLWQANLRVSYLLEADLWQADLQDADLSDAIHLRKEQLLEAIINEGTKLPDYLKKYRKELLVSSKRNLEERDRQLAQPTTCDQSDPPSPNQ